MFFTETMELVIWSWKAVKCNCAFKKDVRDGLVWLAVVLAIALVLAPFGAAMPVALQIAVAGVVGTIIGGLFFFAVRH